jgi:hypothetical protein
LAKVLPPRGVSSFRAVVLTPYNVVGCVNLTICAEIASAPNRNGKRIDIRRVALFWQKSLPRNRHEL